MGELIATVGDRAFSTGQRTQLREVERRRVVAHLADHRLALAAVGRRQRLVGQAVRIADATVRRDVTGRRSCVEAVLPGGITGGADVLATVPEVVQSQHVDVRGVLQADPRRQITEARIIRRGRYWQAVGR